MQLSAIGSCEYQLLQQRMLLTVLRFLFYSAIEITVRSLKLSSKYCLYCIWGQITNERKNLNKAVTILMCCSKAQVLLITAMMAGVPVSYHREPACTTLKVKQLSLISFFTPVFFPMSKYLEKKPRSGDKCCWCHVGATH